MFQALITSLAVAEVGLIQLVLELLVRVAMVVVVLVVWGIHQVLLVLPTRAAEAAVEVVLMHHFQELAALAVLA